ncbi:MAG: hypothetical protein R2681_17225 [Pyrinomonadaceae bacterium]
MASNQLTLSILHTERVYQMMHGLAFFKTLAEKSKENISGLSISGAPTGVTYGDNFDHLTFKRWVKTEFDFQVNEFTRACEKGCDAALNWIESRNKARWSFYESCQTAQKEFSGINERLAAAYQFSARTAASVQYAAETFLIWAPFAAAAPVTLLAASGRLVLYVGSGLAINIAESIGDASSADLLVMPDPSVVAPTIGIGLAGGVAEGQNLIEANEKILQTSTRNINNLTKRIAELERDIAEVQARTNANMRVNTPGGGTAAYNSKINAELTAKLEKSLSDQLANARGELKVQAATQSSAKEVLKNSTPKYRNLFGKGLTTICVILAVSSQVQSTTKFYKHWNCEL